MLISSPAIGGFCFDLECTERFLFERFGKGGLVEEPY